jgi:hypothetical protein
MQSTQLLTPEMVYYDQRDCYMHESQNAVCADFVRIIMGLPHHAQVPKTLQLVVSTEEIPDAYRIKIWKAYTDVVFCWHWAGEDGELLTHLSNGDPTLHTKVDMWLDEQDFQGGQFIWVKVAD